MPTTRRPARTVRALLMMELVAGALGPRPGHSAAAGWGSWTRLLPLRGAPAPVPLIQVQCPGSRVCHALGSPGPGQGHPILESITDGGATCQVVARNVPFPNPNTGSGGLLALTCPAANR